MDGDRSGPENRRRIYEPLNKAQQPVKILELAEDMIRLSGLTPYEDIDIEFTGIRDGEKLFEELEIAGENLLKTRNPKIFIGKMATYSPDQIARALKEFSSAVSESDEREIRRIFNELLPEASVAAGDETAPQTIAIDDADILIQPSKLGLAEK